MHEGYQRYDGSAGLPYAEHKASEEPYGLPFIGPLTMEELHQQYINQWRQYVTGDFYSLRLISVEYGVITGIIVQCESGVEFYAVSDNYTHWEIIGPVTQPNECFLYGYNSEYEPCEFTRETPHMNLRDAGIIRIERMPYHIDDRLTWVGFVVMQGVDVYTWRGQIHIYVDGVLLNPIQPGQTPAISDMLNIDWAGDAIEFVIARNLMNMYPCFDTGESLAFFPSAMATRGDVLSAAVNALELAAPIITEPSHIPFDDVPLTGRGIYIDIAKQMGLVVGVGNNRFAPNQSITRQDMMTMLYNIMMAMGQIQPDIALTALGRFSDFADIADYARLPISSLALAGIISGDGSRINPRGYVTRAEAAVFIKNLYMVGQ